jgi:hypothetical protein
MPTFNLNNKNAWEAWANGQVNGINIDINACGLNDGQGNPDAGAYPGVDTAYADDISDPNKKTTDIHPINLRHLCHLSNKCGFNAVRVILEPEDGIFDSSPRTIDRMTRIFNECERLGMGVILSVKYAPAGMWNTVDPNRKAVWTPGSADGIHGLFDKFWKTAIDKWGTKSALIGIDIVNEPNHLEVNWGLDKKNPIGMFDSTGNPFSPPDLTKFPTVKHWQADPSKLVQVTQRLIECIRSIKLEGELPPIPLIVKGAGDGSATLAEFEDATAKKLLLSDSRLVYSIHSYTPYPITSAAVNEEGFGVATGRLYPGGSYRQHKGAQNYGEPIDDTYGLGEYWGPNATTVNSVASLEEQFKVAIRFKKEYGVPVYLGEFGIIQPRLRDVYPPLPAREKRVTIIDENTPDPRLEQVTVAVNTSVETEAKKYNMRWTTYDGKENWKLQHWSHWVTRIEVLKDNNGKPITNTQGGVRARAYFDNIDRAKFGRNYKTNPTSGQNDKFPPPRPPGQITETVQLTEGELKNDTRFEIGFAVQMTSTDITTLARIDGIDLPNVKPMDWPSSWFKHTVRIKLAADTASWANGLEFDADVELDKYWVDFDAPPTATSMGGDANNLSVVLDTTQDTTVGVAFAGNKYGANKYIPAVALASFHVASTITTEMVDKSRETFVRHHLVMAQRNGISWNFFVISEPTKGFVGWNPSPSMMKLLRDAAAGRTISEV